MLVYYYACCAMRFFPFLVFSKDCCSTSSTRCHVLLIAVYSYSWISNMKFFFSMYPALFCALLARNFISAELLNPPPSILIQHFYWK